MADRSSTSRRRAATSIPRVPRDRPLPLSFAQERLWFLDRLEPGRATYNVPALGFRMRGNLDVAALGAALDAIVRRHEALRTAFPEVDGRPVQAIGLPGPLPLPLIDLAALPEPAREAEARRWLDTEAARPFDLERGPVARALLLRLGPAEHRFLLNLHHIVSDGWSVGVLTHDLAAFYRPRAEPVPPPPLRELPLQPADAAVWQREHLQGEVLERLLGRWRERLGGSLPLLELPTDHPRPAARRQRGGRELFSLGPALSADVLALGVRHRVTPFMLLLTAFAALLHRVSGQDDLLVGFPVAGRGRVELEGLVGFFVNTLVLRSRLPEAAEAPGFGELLARTRAEILEALQDQDLPFERLVEELQPERALSHAPLVQVLFVFQNAPAGELRLPGLTLAPETVGTATAKFDLTFGMGEAAGELLGSLEYDRDLFEPPTVRRLAGALQRLLEGAVADPERPLTELPLLADGERHQLLVEWNDTRRRDPGALVHELFDEQARRTPDAPALLSGGETVTYAALAARSWRLAHRLRALGAGPEVVAGVCAERSPELVTALLAVLGAGGAYLPLDPAAPRERRLGMLRETGAPVLLTQERLAGDFDGFAGEVLLLDRLPEEGPADLPPDFPDSGAFPENLAYVLYTSGSTGRPKGVGVTHRGIVRLARDGGYADLGPDETHLLFSPVSFDASTFEIWGCLLNGGRLAIFPPHLPSLAELGEEVRRAGVTTLWLTAGLFHSFVDEGLSALSGVRQLLAGGDALSPAHVRRALDGLPGVRLINGYGPTECTTFACCHTLTAPPEGPTVPVGRPIGNTRAVVLDRRLRPVAMGVAGELFLGGAGLARGYPGDPGLTAERFLPAEHGERLYRTGDRARWRPDGRLELLGRTDRQVKIRGFRVEPGEIEAALAEHPAVGEAAVVVTGGGDGKRLVAFVAPRPGMDLPAARELRDRLKETLPLYMVPASVVAVAVLPLTPHGKVDRAALEVRASASAESAPGQDFVAPRTPLERKLAEIWAGLLRRDPVGVHDNFFESGGDSLLAIQAVSRAGREGITLSVRQLFRHQTIAELAREVEDPAAAVLAEQGWVTGPVPWTPGPRWFFDRVEGRLLSPHQFSSVQLMEIRADVQPDAVARAAAWLLFQHDVLRLRVERRGESWAMRCLGPEGLEGAFLHADLAAVPEEAWDRAIAGALHDIRHQPELDGPLARFVLFTLPARPARLLAVLHHLVSDGPSWHILLEDLETALARQRAGDVVRLPPKTTSFRRWAERQNELARSAEMRAQVEFWLEAARRTGEEPGEGRLPADFSEALGKERTGDPGAVEVALSAEETAALLAALPASRGQGVPNAVLAALAQTFAEWTGAGALLIRQTTHGRDPVLEDVDLSRTVGWISTTAPVLLAARAARTAAEALAAVEEQVARMPLRGLGYGILRYLTGDPGIEAQMRTVMASAMATFNFLGRAGGGAAEGRLLASLPLPGASRPLPRVDAQLRVTAVMSGDPSRLSFSWEYGLDFYRPETIETLAASCLAALRSLMR